MRGGLWLFVEEFRCGGGVHDVRPDLFFGGYCSFRHGVVGHPCVRLATGNEAEDCCDKSPGITVAVFRSVIAAAQRDAMLADCRLHAVISFRSPGGYVAAA